MNQRRGPGNREAAGIRRGVFGAASARQSVLPTGPRTYKVGEENVEYEVVGNIYLIPLLDIFVDSDFNCRGQFNPQEVHDLGKDITKQGQLVPLIIQPINDVPDNERPEPCAWQFRLIAGHRRYMALDYWTTQTHAKCCIETGLTKDQARVLNFTENLKREDLNILEEAQGLNESWPSYEIKDIARLVGESKRWVQVRLDLLRLPDYVQRKAATGQISQYDIETLASLEPDQIEPTFQNLISTQGQKGHLPVVKGRQPWRNRPRGKIEIGEMISFLYAHHRFSNLSEDGRDFITSTLAWVSKGIDSREFLENRLGFPAGCVIVDSNDKVTQLTNED